MFGGYKLLVSLSFQQNANFKTLLGVIQLHCFTPQAIHSA
ncbi:hypothetical protein FDUTEX481_04249 [Tolypothrix sp. PCC 7601]|nr:hypothetical protein FDUTEX481_04249 [Tolypothrix sp. PCC 7601]